MEAAKEPARFCVNCAQMVKVSDILERAANRLDKPGAWMKGALASDRNGYIVDPQSPQACAWCLAGAIAKECHDAGCSHFAATVADILVEYLPWNFDDIEVWSDDYRRTQGEVVALLRECAADLRTHSK